MQRRPTGIRLPSSTLLESGGVPAELLAAMAMREGQSTNPMFRVHRWFARRLSVQFRSLLAGISLDASEGNLFWDRFYGDINLSGAVVLDPFVGGGTSLVEAALCGAKVVGYDIDPVAAGITRMELDLYARDDLPQSFKEIVQEVGGQIREHHRTITPAGEEAEVLHHFWVERRACSRCLAEFDLHPHHRLACDSAKGLQWVFCRSCDAVRELPLDQTVLDCYCGTRTVILEGSVARGRISCPSCGNQEELSARGRREGCPPAWRLFAQEYIVTECRRVSRKFKAVEAGDLDQFAAAARELSSLERDSGAFAPRRLIPATGRSDGRPLIHGFRSYRELFNHRQLLHLTRLGVAIASVSDERERRLLGMAFSDHLTSNCMYTGYAFGYRRVSPLFSIHSYRHITRPVELNPWLDGIGRGTFPNALNKIRRAAQFAQGPRQIARGAGRIPAAAASGVRRQSTCHATIRTESSVDLSALANASVDIILTDPPYFDNLSYSELSDFYLAWHQCLGIALPPYDDPSRAAPISENLAIVDRSVASVERYTATLSAILSECRRVLKPRGLCVFTFHHRAIEAWHSLGMALAASGLRCGAVVPSRGEGQGGLHSYEGTIKWDAVLACRRGPAPRTGLAPLFVAENDLTSAHRDVEKHEQHLGAVPKIAFRLPDRLNLLRGMLVARARPWGKDARLVPLREALRGVSPKQ